MMPLVEKYKPATLAEFVGLDRPRAILSHLAAEPYDSAWLLLGPSGLGKTTMALALAEQINGQVHHVPSRKCDLETVDQVIHSCWYVPMNGGFHVVLVDEADQMSRAAQLAFLSKLDTTAAPPKTIFIFTANATTLLEDRFLSRCRILKFTHDSLLEPAASLLQKIWQGETNSARPEPDFREIVRTSDFNIRQSIMNLELEIIAFASIIPKLPAALVTQISTPLSKSEILNAHEVARLLGINIATIYNRVKQGRLPSPNGRPMTWRRSEIETYA